MANGNNADKVVLRIFRAAVSFRNLEHLIPEPSRLFHVVDADVDKR